jgi:hypothetical protein
VKEEGLEEKKEKKKRCERASSLGATAKEREWR